MDSGQKQEKLVIIGGAEDKEDANMAIDSSSKLSNPYSLIDRLSR